MSVSTDTTIAGCLRNVASDLKEWADAKRAGFAVAKNPLRSLELLACAPDGLTLILSFTGAASESDNVYRQNRRLNFSASLIKNDPLDVSPEADYRAAPNETLSLLDVVDELQARVMSFTPPCVKPGRDSDMDRVKDEGIEPLQDADEMPLRGYVVKFSFKVQPPLLNMRQ